MKRLLGIDLGRVRTGIAISDELRMLAHPLETFETQSSEELARRIKTIALEKDIDCVVIGLPRHMNGSFGEGAKQAQAFAEKLRKILTCEIVTWDERLSTVAAERALQAAGKTTRQTKAIRDQVAAQMILQNYLDRLGA